MALGVTIGFLLLQLSGMFVWDVRVSGNVTLSEEEVCASLRACGFGVGSRISDASLEQIENRVLIESDRIAWISVYMDGTVAVVQIRENEQTPPAEPKLPANLIAACDGQIEYLELYRGDSVVKVGQAVKAGDLLVSGVYDSQTEGVRYTRAAGQVLARVEEEIVVEIPLFDTEKRYLTDSIGEIWLDFFDFSIKIFKNSRNPNASCDIIEDRKEIDFWGLHDLPFGFRVQRLLDYTLEPIERTAQEAEAIAYARLDEILAENAEEVMLLQKTIQTSVTEQSVVLTCRIVCIKNIAVQSEFEVLP